MGGRQQRRAQQHRAAGARRAIPERHHRGGHAEEAGEAAGGDSRGRQAAGLVIHQGQTYASIDIRADDHAHPLAELRRLLAVSEERYAIFATAMATTENFSGMVDRKPLDEAISNDEAYRKKYGITSQSHAVPPA